MPFLFLTTNVQVLDVKAFVAELLETASKIFEFPPNNITVSYRYEEHLAIAGAFEPGFHLQISGIAKLTHADNDAHSPPFFDFLSTKLGVSKERGFIAFHDLGATQLANNSVTYATLWAKDK